MEQPSPSPPATPRTLTGRLAAERAPILAAVAPFQRESRAQLRLLALDDRGLADCEEATGCDSLEILLLSSNVLTRLSAVDLLPRLRKLDLSGNRLAALPPAEFWAPLASLQVLHLHANQLQSAETLKSLAPLSSLRILTAYRNPLALNPFYRGVCVRELAPSLCVLDHFAVSLEEILADRPDADGYAWPDKYAAFSPNLIFRPSTALSDRLVEQLQVLDDEVRRARLLFLRWHPVAMIQRTFRGYLYRTRRAEAKAARLFQGAIRGFLSRRREGLGLDPTRTRAVVAVNDPTFSLIFVDTDRALVRELVARALSGGKGAQNAAEDIEFTPTRFAVMRPFSNEGNSTAVVRVALRGTGCAVGSLWHRKTRARPSAERDTFSDLRRLRRPASNIALLPAAELVARFSTAQDEQGTFSRYSRLLSYSAPNANTLMTIYEAIEAFNAGNAFVPPLNSVGSGGSLPYGGRQLQTLDGKEVVVLAAVCAIQASWRAHWTRATALPSLYTRACRYRACIWVQRWWKSVCFRRRLRFLADLNSVIHSIDSPTVFIDEEFLQQADDPFAWPRAVRFDEQRFCSTAAFDENGDICVAGDHSAAQLRRGLPTWLACAMPTYSGASSGLVTNSQVMGSGALIDSLGVGTKSFVFLARRRFHALRFASVDEARRRAVALVCRTWRIGSGGSGIAIRLMTLDTLKRAGAATSIQRIARERRHEGQRRRRASRDSLDALPEADDALAASSVDDAGSSFAPDVVGVRAVAHEHGMAARGVTPPVRSDAPSNDMHLTARVLHMVNRDKFDTLTSLEVEHTSRQEQLMQLQFKAHAQREKERRDAAREREPRYVDRDALASNKQLLETVSSSRNAAAREQHALVRASELESNVLVRGLRTGIGNDARERKYADRAHHSTLRNKAALSRGEAVRKSQERSRARNARSQRAASDVRFASTFGSRQNAIVRQAANADMRRFKQSLADSTYAKGSAARRESELRARKIELLRRLRLEEVARRVTEDENAVDSTLLAMRAQEDAEMQRSRDRVDRYRRSGGVHTARPASVRGAFPMPAPPRIAQEGQRRSTFALRSVVAKFAE